MNKPQHAPMSQFPIQNGVLHLAGKSVCEIARDAGSTPFYAYDRQVIESRIRSLRQVFPASVKLHYAIKANPMPELLHFISSRVDGLDVASAQELALALESGMAAWQISFAGPGKRQTELEAAVHAGVLINAESPRELTCLAQVSQSLGQPARVALRINPDFELKSSGMKMGGGPKPFGIDAEQIPAILHDMTALNLQFEGFHIFSGSQNLRPEAIIEAQQQAYQLALRLAEHAPAPIRTLNLGGGFGIPYFPGDRPLDLAPIGENLHRLAERTAQDLPAAELVIELGRYLVGEAGIYVCRVIDKKISRGQIFLVCDGGLHHHLAASGNFGQVIRKNYPVIIGNKASPAQTETVTIVGPLCTPLDILAERMELAVADVGDLVVIYQSGAYGLTASPRAFLGHPDAPELLL